MIKELTLKRKLRFIDDAIITLKSCNNYEYLICLLFDNWMEKKYSISIKDYDDLEYYIPELWQIIQAAIKYTKGDEAIHYRQPIISRIRLLNRVKKQLLK